MKYKKIELDNYNIHLMKTDKFKSTFISLVLINEYNKDYLLKNFVLRRLLTTSSKNLKDETEVTKKVCELYNSGITISNSILNKTISTRFDMEVLDDKYTENGLFYNALDYFFDSIFNPNIINGKFEKNNYDLVIKSINEYFDKEKENKIRYAYDKAYSLMDEDFLKYPLNGFKEDLKNINEKVMADYYKEFIKGANANLFVIGDINEKELISYLKNNKNIKFYNNENKYIDCTFDENTSLKKDETKENNNQSILILIYKIMNLTKRERNEVIPIFNRIFGGSSNSRLFKSVREKNSLCYGIRSSYSRTSSTMSIESGISYKNKDKVIELINKELKNIQDGNITDEEFNEAINFRKKNLKQFDDYIDSLLFIKQSSILFNNDDLDERRKQVDTITKEEIKNLANKIKLNVEYILKGDKDNE